MRRLLIRDLRRSCIFLAIAVMLTGLFAYSQSLGDIARETREQKAAKESTAPPKVITNKDLEADPDNDSTPAPAQQRPQSSPANAAASRKAAQQRAVEQRAADQWRQKVLTQRYAIAKLQAKIDWLKASIQSVNSNGPYEPLVYTRYQARQLERLKETQLELDQQRHALEDMQEAARKAGMHTPVYDP